MTSTEAPALPQAPIVPVSFSMPLRQLRAMSLFTSSDETRYVIGGVKVEFGKRDALLIATDGRCLGVLFLGAVHEAADAAGTSFIIPAEMIRRAWQALRVRTENEDEDEAGEFYKNGTYSDISTDVTIELTASGQIILRNGDYSLGGKPIEGKYPDWRKVIPTAERCQKRLNVNATLLNKFTQAVELLAQGRTTTLVRGFGPSDDQGQPYSIQFPGVPFFGLLMPMKVSSIAPEVAVIPEWLTAEA